MTALWICLGVAALAAAAVFLYLSNNLIKCARYSLKIEGMESLKIVHLSDLHGKTFGKDNARLIKKVAAMKPDLIAFTGDAVHTYREKDMSAALRTLIALAKICPVAYCAGNHDTADAAYSFLKYSLSEGGVTVLDDKCQYICGNCVAGLNYESLKGDKIFTAFGDEKPKILLAHDPRYFSKYAAAGFKLILCGHTHGGQWRIPFTRVGLYAPGQGVFPKYASGKFENGESVMIVSCGLGNSVFPLRLFNRPEIVEIKINLPD